MNRQNSESNVPSQPSALSTQAGSLSRWQSSSSFGSTAPEDRRADHFFDQIEDLLVEMMNDPAQRRLHCRFLQGQFHQEQPPKVFTAVLVVMPPLPKE